MLLLSVFLVVLWLAPTATHGQGELDAYEWPPEQQRQREDAIAARDESKLPECTEEYFAWRDQAKDARLLKDHAPSKHFWDNPGCKGVSDGGAWGPKARPGLKPEQGVGPKSGPEAYHP